MSLPRTSTRFRLAGVLAAAGAAALMVTGCATDATPAASSGAAASSVVIDSPAPSSAPASAASESPAASAGSAAESAAESQAAPSAADGTFPVTVTAGNGDVTVAAKPVSIASLSPTATEMLYAIGAGDQVTVVDKNSDYPESGLPAARVDSFQLNVEALTAYKPDLVITSGVTPDQQAAFGKLGMTMLAETAPTDLDGVYAQITQLGQVTGHVAGAAEVVADMKAKVADILAEVPKAPRPLTYYYELDQTFYSVTSQTFIGSVLKQLGLTSIADTATGAAAAGGYPQLSAEFILKANPDYILLADTKCCEQSPAAVAARDGWKALAAVQQGRVIGLDDDIASRWSPRIVDLMATIADALKEHPVAQ